MKTKGVDPKVNGLPKELERVKDVVSRAKQIADKAFAPKVDVSAARRFIRGGLWEPKDGDPKEDSNSNSQINEKGTPSKPPPNKRIRFDAEGNVESTQSNSGER